MVPYYQSNSLIENEPLERPRRKLLGPGPTPEYIFRPCLKMVKQIREKRKLPRFHDELVPAKTEGRTFYPKKYYFEEKGDYLKTITARQAKLLLQNKILNKDSNSSKSGFTKQFFENISNNKILGVTITKDVFNQMTKSAELPRIQANDYLKSSKNIWKVMENKKIASLKMEQENLQRDIDYVASLNERDKEK